MARLLEDKRIIWPSKMSGRPRFKRYQYELMDEFTGLSSILNTVYNTQGTRELKDLFDGKQVMDFPKPVDYMKLIVQQGTASDGDAIILDFFAGSCPLAQAVLETNRAEGSNRVFIMAQLPEPTGNPDFPTIADIGKERIRRVITRMKTEAKRKMDLSSRERPEDLGFKVFKLAESNYRPWVGVEEKDPEEYAKQMELYLDPLLEGWKEENVIYEVAIKEGYSLSSQIVKIEEVNSNTIWKVTDDDKEQSFHICLDGKIDEEAVKALDLNTENLFICRDIALTDELAANLALQCNLKVI